VTGGVDVVVPFFNEQDEIEGLFMNLATQTDLSGRPLDRSLVRVIFVDNASTDDGRSRLEGLVRAHPALNCLVVDEPVKSHIQARIAGIRRALEGEGPAHPVLVNIDADTRFAPTWIADIVRHFADPSCDVLVYSGFFPPAFWRRVPALVHAYYRDVGTIFFHPDTIAEFELDAGRALFSESLFRDFGRLPSDCGFALRKTVYVAAGGYTREYDDSGTEVLGEGWRLKLGLDRIGARTRCSFELPYLTSPRRLLHESQRLIDGQAYAGGMLDIRQVDDEAACRRLEAFGRQGDVRALRNYVVRNYIVLPCLSDPALVDRNPAWFSGDVALLADEMRAWARGPRHDAVATFAYADALCARHAPALIAQQARRLAG
jgi:glycosyltransferase involved in cell wall biosynthesis